MMKTDRTSLHTNVAGIKISMRLIINKRNVREINRITSYRAV